MLGAVQDAEDAEDNVMLDGSEASLPHEDIYEVRDATGRLLGRSSNWTGPPSAAQWKTSRIDGRQSNDHHTTGSFNPEAFLKLSVSGRTYRLIRMQGLRIVDPGEKTGGVRRYVTVYYGSPVSRVWNAIFRAVGFYAISSLVVLAATGILMSWFLTRGLAPLRELAAGAATISASSWTFTPPKSARMTRELAPLVGALEKTLAGLERSFNQQKRFVGDAAHELKTSVAVVKSSLQLLSMKPRNAKEYQVGLERCLSDCERMEAVVAQMLTLARLEGSHPEPSLASSTDISTCLQEVIEELATMAEASQMILQFQCEQSIQVPIDTQQFKLLCTNLLINAVQHSPAGSKIAVEVSRRYTTAEIRIIDHGEGIASEDLPHLFERFYRSDPSRNRKTGGTGLGLAISKAIVDRHHGHIQILSELGAGTTVLIHFPIAEWVEK